MEGYNSCNLLLFIIVCKPGYHEAQLLNTGIVLMNNGCVHICITYMFKINENRDVFINWNTFVKNMFVMKACSIIYIQITSDRLFVSRQLTGSF